MSELWETDPTFAVVLKGTVIGTVNFKIDANTKSAMVGYVIGRSWWRQAVAFEATNAAMTWAANNAICRRSD
jgi:RimJ/RimL family protein N-acetyltransferase